MLVTCRLSPPTLLTDISGGSSAPPAAAVQLREAAGHVSANRGSVNRYIAAFFYKTQTMEHVTLINREDGVHCAQWVNNHFKHSLGTILRKGAFYTCPLKVSFSLEIPFFMADSPPLSPLDLLGSLFPVKVSPPPWRWCRERGMFSDISCSLEQKHPKLLFLFEEKKNISLHLNRGTQKSLYCCPLSAPF